MNSTWATMRGGKAVCKSKKSPPKDAEPPPLSKERFLWGDHDGMKEKFAELLLENREKIRGETGETKRVWAGMGQRLEEEWPTRSGPCTHIHRAKGGGSKA